MAVIGVIAVVLIVLGWFLWPSKTPPRRDVDNAELAEAERDVQETADEKSIRD